MLHDVRLGRTTAFIVALVIATALITGGVLHRGMSRDIRMAEERLLEDALREAALRQKARLQRIEGVTTAMISVPPIEGLRRAAADGYDAADSSTAAQWLARMSGIFQSLLRANPDLLQARLLSLAGRELVRVQRIGQEIRPVEAENLQDKGGRDYVRTAHAAAPSTVVVIPITLNREQGPNPHEGIPMLRSMARSAGTGAVIVVLNFDARALEADLRAALPGVAGARFAMTRDGLLLFDTASGAALGADPAREAAMTRELARVQEGMRGAEAPPDGPWRLVSEEGDLILAQAAPDSASAPAGGAPGGRGDLLWLAAPRAQAYANSEKSLRLAVLLVAGVAAVGGMLAWGIGARQSRGMRRLRDAAEAVRRNPDAAPDWPREDRGAVGVVAQAFAGAVAELGTLRELEAEQRGRLAAVLNSVSAAIISADAQGVIEQANRAADEMFGVRAGGLIGRSVVSLMLPAEAAGHEAAMALARTNRGARRLGYRERMALRDDGGAFPIRLSTSKRGEGAEAIFSAVIEDLTDLRRTERVKREFLSAVSHELRTPLASVKGALAMLEAGVSGAIDAEARGLTALAAKNCERLARLIDDLLDAERLSDGRFEFDVAEVDLRVLLEEALALNAPVLSAAGLSPSLRAPLAGEALVRTDRDRVLQVLTNLLSNAAKFSPAGSEVALTLEEIGPGWEVAVRDHGRGVPATFRAALFERFSQAQAGDSKRQGGVGLGLNICRAIVSGLGGAIGHQSPSGGGARFWFWLPQADQGIPAIRIGAHSGAATLRALPMPAARLESGAAVARLREHLERNGIARPVQALHVEDDEDTRALMLQQLQEMCEVVSVETVSAAAEELDRRRFDVVILDLRIGGERGETLLTHPCFSATDAPLVMVYSVEEARGLLLERVDGAAVKSSTRLPEFADALYELLLRHGGLNEEEQGS